MSVYITFEPQKESGVVAEGTFLLDAAKRLGVSIPTECRGIGECDTCALLVQEGAGLLSLPTSAEHERLSEERLTAGERLACQTKVERSGELVLRSLPSRERKETVEEAASRFREEFRELPLGRKITRLAEFEAVSAFEALTTIASLPFRVGEKVLDVVADFGRKKRAERQVNRPDERSAEGETPAVPEKSPTR